MNAWVAVIGAVLSCIIGLWKYFGRKAATKRKIMEDAQKDLDNAHKNKDESGILDAWDKSGRV